MKKGINSFVVLFALMVSGAWQTTRAVEIKKAGGLIKTWESKIQNGILYETWSKTNEMKNPGKSYFIQGEDTASLETFRLLQEQESLLFIPRVKIQVNKLPIRFSAKSVSEILLVFENPSYAFAQIISNTKGNTHSLLQKFRGLQTGRIV